MVWSCFHDFSQNPIAGFKNNNIICANPESVVLDDFTFVTNTIGLRMDELNSHSAVLKRQYKLGEEQFSLVTVAKAYELRENMLNHLTRFQEIITASNQYSKGSWIQRFQFKSTKSNISSVRSLVQSVIVRPRQEVLFIKIIKFY